MNSRLQFRVLYRQFLFRLMDVEMLSSSARGDSSELLGQLGALLIFGSVVSTLAAITAGQRVAESGLPDPVWQTERFLLSLNMLVVGVFALLSWDSTFPGRRDVLVLAPLPIPGRTMFIAKIAAVASALGLVVAAWNSLAAFGWPMVLAPHDAGGGGTLRFIAAFWVVQIASALFLYCSVLALQGLAAQLPRRWYLRVAPVLQIGAFMLLLGVVFFQPAWFPACWFVGLLSELSGAYTREGHAIMPLLAVRAIAGLSIAILAAAAAFLLSYLRTLRQIVEQPDVAAASRTGISLPLFGNRPQTALAHFILRTLTRSRQHRAILALYLGGGSSIVAIYVGAARAQHQVDTVLPVSSAVILAAAWLGARTVFSLPLDLRANWLFRVIPMPAGQEAQTAIRRSLLALSVLPVCAAAAAILLAFRPWKAALGHVLVLALAGSALVDFSLRGFRKIPFTCSYLPGKSKAHLVFWFGIIPVVILIHKAAVFETDALSDRLTYAAMVATLAAAALVARRTSQAGAETQFEETPSDALIGLGLNR
jgi:hypothetical protein